MKVLPTSGVLCTAISPPSTRAYSRLMVSPSPVPPYLRVIDVSACWKASKILSSCSDGMPMPVSETANAITAEARCSDALP